VEGAPSHPPFPPFSTPTFFHFFCSAFFFEYVLFFLPVLYRGTDADRGTKGVVWAAFRWPLVFSPSSVFVSFMKTKAGGIPFCSPPRGFTLFPLSHGLEDPKKSFSGVVLVANLHWGRSFLCSPPVPSFGFHSHRFPPFFF